MQLGSQRTEKGNQPAVFVGVVSKLKAVIPRPIRDVLRRLWLYFYLRYCLSKLRKGVPPEDLLDGLRRAWGNQWSGNVSYLAEVCKVAATIQGPILECGCGLTTILLGVYAAERGIQVISLEHLETWTRFMNQQLRSLHLPNRVLQAPLSSYLDFDWYSLPSPLPSRIALVVCDGPPGTTRGGRYGVLPVCQPYFADNCIILLDDAERPGEQAAISNWQRRFGFAAQLKQTQNGCFARLSKPSHPTEAIA